MLKKSNFTFHEQNLVSYIPNTKPGWIVNIIYFADIEFKNIKFFNWWPIKFVTIAGALPNKENFLKPDTNRNLMDRRKILLWCPIHIHVYCVTKKGQYIIYC